MYATELLPTLLYICNRLYGGFETSLRASLASYRKRPENHKSPATIWFRPKIDANQNP
jgi:hypothetical protein